VLIASAMGQTFSRKERVTLYGGGDRGPVLGSIQAQNPGPLTSYLITLGAGTLLGSLRATSWWLPGVSELCDPDGARVGAITVEWRRRFA
jgi:hypothetical protein